MASCPRVSGESSAQLLNGYKPHDTAPPKGEERRRFSGPWKRKRLGVDAMDDGCVTKTGLKFAGVHRALCAVLIEF